MTQEKFCVDPQFNESKSMFKDFKWCIPLEFRTGRSPRKAVHTAVMNSKMQEICVGEVLCSDWVKVILS